MTTSLTVFTLTYVTVAMCFVFKMSEFVSAGVTVESMFSWYLKSEYENFIFYHIRRSTITYLLHTLLPLGYILGVYVVLEAENETFFLKSTIWWRAFEYFAIILPILTMIVFLHWHRDNWSNHPISRTLKLFSDGNSWRYLALDINAEFRRLDKIVLKTSSLSSVIATDNWLMKVSPYNVNITHQSDSVLILCSAETHHLSVDGAGTVQYVNIEVKTTRPGVKPFYIRCNALDFRDLQDRLSRPISVLQGITFHKTKIEQFLDVFKETINQNPPYVPPVQLEEIEMCIGCMVMPSSVKLVKHCDQECTNCYCRPLWCVDCMGKWFASRQEQDKPETWLSSRCTCPICRSVFCILDVCPLQTN